MADSVSRSWFAVGNNPEEHGFKGSPEEICKAVVDMWCNCSDTRTCAVNYCVSADGLHHLHCVFEDTKTPLRFSAVQKTFPGFHLEETKGNKKQVEDYINKVGKFEEKGEIILASARHGEIVGCQGRRTDLEEIEELLNQGLTPDEILDTRFSYGRYEKMINNAFYRKRLKETPVQRNVLSYWHIGDSGSGKTHEYVNLCDEYGRGEVYFVNDYLAPFDEYNGQRIVFCDEFRGQVPFSTFLTTYTGEYVCKAHCRFNNRYTLWNEIHFSTVLPPELCYENMVSESNRKVDTYQQMLRRIDIIVYHYKDERGNFYKFELPMCEYKDYEDLKEKAMKYFSGEMNFFDDFPESIPQDNLHFDD